MSLRLFVKAFSSTLALLCAAIGADSPNDLIAKGDACDQKFQAAEALQFYLPAEKPQPTNVHVLVRVARQYRYLMADATTRDDKLRLGGIFLDYAQRAAALAPKDAEAQLSIAISYGKMLPLMGATPAETIIRISSPKPKQAARAATNLISRGCAEISKFTGSGATALSF